MFEKTKTLFKQQFPTTSIHWIIPESSLALGTWGGGGGGGGEGLGGDTKGSSFRPYIRYTAMSTDSQEYEVEQVNSGMGYRFWLC